MSGLNCNNKFLITKENYRNILREVKEELGNEFNDSVFQTIVRSYSGDINSLTKEYVLEHYPRKNAPQEKISKGTDNTNVIIRQYSDYWTRDEVASPENQDKLFIFTDNTDRGSGNMPVSDDSKYAQKYGKGKKYPKKSTSAVIRGLDNAMPISTQRWYHGEFKREKGRWTNADVEEFRKTIHQEIDDIIDEWNTGNYTVIVLPKGGLFTESEITGINDSERSEIKKVLQEEINRLYTSIGADTSEAILEASEEIKATQSKKEARKLSREEKARTNMWGREAPDGQGFEVSSAGNELGKKFSALNAVLAEGTTLKIKRSKTEIYIFDVGGYSIEAAYQLVKGYDGNPKGSLLGKDGKVAVQIKGKGKAPISKALRYDMSSKASAAAKEAAEDESYNLAYLPLWKLWVSQNPNEFAELKKTARNKILTDKYAKTRVSQARALAELIHGTPREVVSDRIKERWEILRENAVKAAQAVSKIVKRNPTMSGLQVFKRDQVTDKEIENRVKNKNSKGQSTTDNKYLLSFSLQGVEMDSDLNLFINPFEDEKNEQKAVAKFIQWIMPDDYDSLPRELRREEARRNTIRTYLAKGGYRTYTIVTDDSSKNQLYARTLRYVIDNFRELRQRYNPIDIIDFGLNKHNVKVSYDNTDTEGRTLLFTPVETSESVAPSADNSVKLVLGAEGNESMVFVTFPSDFGERYSSSQQDRLVKTVAMAVPEGQTVTMDAPVAFNDALEAYEKMTSRGFTKTGETEVATEDGLTKKIGTFRRNGFVDQKVITRDPYSLKDIEEIAEPGHKYIVEIAEAGNSKSIAITDNMITIPVTHDRNQDVKTSYWNDGQFEQFKAYVDKAIKQAKEYIDNGGKVVIPKGYIGNGNANLSHYAPKCYEYLNRQLEELQEYGNKEFFANQYLSSTAPTVKSIETAPSEAVSLDTSVLQGPKARLRQMFKDIEIQDLSSFIAKKFIFVAESEQENLIKETKARIAAKDSADDIDKLEHKLRRLQNPRKGLVYTINEIGIESILEKVRTQQLSNEADRFMGKDDAISQKYTNASDKDIFDLLFSYATSIIEDRSGIRVNANSVVNAETEDENKREKEEDTDGENSPEMSWTYNYRLVDPYKSLTKSMRKIISNIPMRDPNDMRKVLKDSIGQTRTWDPKYIYYSIMSRMAKMSMGNVDNFVVITPYEQLSEQDKKNFPIGKPYFPVFEDMKEQYPWANDLISALRLHYSTIDTSQGRFPKDMTTKEVADNPVTIAEIGNVVSQFYSNFCNQFVSYCTMVDGNIIAENSPSGEVSLRNATITNYNGGIRFKGVDMIYNSDGSVNSAAAENIEKKAALLREKMRSDTKAGREFWDEIKRLQKKYEGDSMYKMMEDASKELKNTAHEVSQMLLSCGMVFSNHETKAKGFADYNIFCIIAGKNKHGITELLSELEMCMKAIKGLPENEHIFESSMTLDMQDDKNRKFESPRFYWNKFFEKFGDYVTEREYENNARILGKSRYSYVHPSFMNTEMQNLTNPNIDERRKYIEENYMKYDWYYDSSYSKDTPKDDIERICLGFKNTILADLYRGSWSVGSMMAIGRGKMDDAFGMGHDLICKKDGSSEKEYSQWTPEDILQIMFRELSQPQNKDASCFIAPVFSDSQVCRAIQAKKLSIGGSIEVMTNVVLQELDRMKLVEKRNTILRMQDLIEKIDKGLDISSEDRTYYNDNLAFYNKWKESHPGDLQETENFDKNGSKFCFFPELNKYSISVNRAKDENNAFMLGVIRALTKDPNNVSTKDVSLKTVLTTLQNTSESDFQRRAATAGLTVFHYWNEKNEVPTKEETINRVISDAITSVMNNKIRNFFWDMPPFGDRRGRVNEAVLQGIIRNDSELMSEYYKVNISESRDKPLTAEQEKALNDFYEKLYNKAEEFYYNHTAMMSQFLELMVTDIAYYKDPTTFKGSVDFGKRFKETNGAGIKMNTNSKFGKKIERNIILKDSVRRSSSYNVFNEALQKAVDEGRILDYEMDSILYKMRGIMGTDAQAYRSLTSWRDIMDMTGKYTEELASAINNLENGTWTMKDFYVTFDTIKPFTFGPEDQDSGIDDIRMRTMVQHKNSEAVLLAIYDTIVGSHEGDMNYSKKLAGLNRAMEKIELLDDNGQVMTYANGDAMKAIDVAQYQSAVKVGAHGVIDINYSRDALDRVHKKGKLTVGKHEIEVKKSDSYYTIEEKISKLLDSNKISFQEYEDAMDIFEPDADEVFSIIENAIYKNGDKSLGYDDQVLHKIPYKYYSIQNPTDDHYTDNLSATFGSQPRHIIIADLPDDFSIEINGKKYNREQLRDRYNGLITANLIDSYTREIEPLFKDEDSKKSAVERLRDRLMPLVKDNPKYKQLEDALEIVTDSNGNKIFALSPNDINVSHQLAELITSLFKNAIHKQEISGGNVILAADVGYSHRLEVIGKKGADGKYERVDGIECLLPAHMRSMLEPYMLRRKGSNGDYWVLDEKKLHKDGLDKLIGYRIPTEGLYSIMPLVIKGFLPQQSGSSIVVAQDITLLTGSDNDVDKLYLMMKALTKDLKNISTPRGKEIHPLEMSKEQRDNEIIDIFYGIATHPQMLHLWAHPGNFDNLIINAKRLKILKDKDLRDKFIEYARLDEDANGDIQKINARLIKALSGDLSQKQYNELYRRVMRIPEGEELKDDKTIRDIVVDFTDNYLEPLSPVYPDTFVEMHQIYMAGVAEKGIFANNTLDHAKLQWADVRLMPTQTFKFNGVTVDKVDARTVLVNKNGKQYIHYISQDCAECSAAAVDNGKTPVLNDLNSNINTASFYGFLMRLGLGIEGASLLLAQPSVDSSIKTTGRIDAKRLDKDMKDIEEWLKEHNFNEKDDRFNWRLHNFTTQELYENIVGESLSSMRYKKGGDDVTVERMASLYRTYDLILNLRGIFNEMKTSRDVIHYDSPKHAADITIGGVVEQTKAVEALNSRKELPGFDRRISGDDQLIIYDIERKYNEKKKATSKGKEQGLKGALQGINPRYNLYDALMSSPLPITQGFYTLGIEKIRKEIAPMFAFGRPEIQALTDRLYQYMNSHHIYREEDRRKITAQMYADWVTYRLSDTNMFGYSDDMSLEEKRQYYLYDFPGKFLQDKNNIEGLNDIDAVRRMSVLKGLIRMDRQGQTTTTLRDFITNSFDTLQQSDNPDKRKVANDLMLYTYYLNGFDLSYMSFGNMFSTEFKRAYSEYVKALNDMNTAPISEKDMDNFFDQFILKRSNMGLIPKMNFNRKSQALQTGEFDTGKKVSEWGLIDDVPRFVFGVVPVGNRISNTLLKLNRGLTELYGTVIYTPVKTNTYLHYNANITADELTELVYDQDKINNNYKLGRKKRNKDAVNYDSHQSSKDWNEKSNAKDANVFEPENESKYSDVDRNTVSAAAKDKSDDSREVSADTVNKAIGSSVAQESDPTAGYDVSSSTAQMLRKQEEGNTPSQDISAGQAIIASNNNGREACV